MEDSGLIGEVSGMARINRPLSFVFRSPDGNEGNKKATGWTQWLSENELIRRPRN
jgi:hypothetical protein